MPAHKAPPWTRAEIAALREIYPREGLDGCTDALADRTWAAIHQKAHKLGLKCEKVFAAPEAKLRGTALEEAIRLREGPGWSFARIGAKFGLSEAAANNAVLSALCIRKGYTPAQRDRAGRLTEEGRARVRLALKKGLKGVDIQLRLGLSAGRVAEERRRYNRELRLRALAPLPPPGGGAAYCGVKLTRKVKAAVEALYLQGLGTKKIHERTGVSHTSIVRIRTRLIARLRRKGEALPGCDARGVRRTQLESLARVHPAQQAALRELLLSRVPVRRAAALCAIGSCSAYRLRDELKAELAARGEVLPDPVRPGRLRRGAREEGHWPPRGQAGLYAFRVLLAAMPEGTTLAEAKDRWRRERIEEVQAERGAAPGPALPSLPSFEDQLEAVASGRRGLAPAFARAHLEPRWQPEARPPA